MSIIKRKDLFRLFCCGEKKLHVLPRVVVIGLLLLASALAFANDVSINSTTFPDSVFRAYVQKLAGSTETLPQSVIDKTTTFGNDLKGLGITSLKGIEYFTNLTTLYCQDNPGLTSLDLSGNGSLKVLNITGCKVTSLDFTNNLDMTIINCSNMKSLTSINVSKCSKLTSLSVPQNLLTKLDVSQNTSLTTLSCYSNQLSTLDLSNNKALTTLYAFNNSKLTNLDLTNNTNLTYLSVYSNNMPSLDVSKLTKLQNLYCFKNKLTTLDVSKNTALTELSCYTNQLTTLDLSNNRGLIDLDCHDNKLASLILNPTVPTQMKFIRVEKNALASIDLSGYTNLVVKDGQFFTNPNVTTQTRTMMLYTDGTDAYMKVGGGIDASKISNAKLNFTDGSTSEDLTFTVGTEFDGLVPLKFSNRAVRKRFFNWTTSTKKASPITITYNYDTGSTLSALATMDVTFTVECYMLPMSAEYGTVNLPYDVLLPTGATAYAVTATSVKAGSDDNYATLTPIATAGEIVPANTPMLIKRADNTYTLFALNQSTGTATEASSNLLKGTQNTAIANNEYYYVLGLNNSSHKLGFWRSTNSKIGTWRAYLDLSETATSAKGFFLSLDSTPTGISDMEMPRENVNAPWYTIDGRTLGAMPTQKGIYIHQGKKIVITK